MRCSLGSPLPSRQGGLARIAGITLLAAVALPSACQDASAPAAGWLTAVMREAMNTGESETPYQGTGDFHVGRDPGVGQSVVFHLYSRGTGASVGQSLLLYRPGNGRPAPGRYELAPLESEDGRLEGFTAYYFRDSGGRHESFTALSGYVVVRASSDDRVEGEFQFTGVLYCLTDESPGSDIWCVHPNIITPGAPKVEVTGSFAATPLKPGPESITPR